MYIEEFSFILNLVNKKLFNSVIPIYMINDIKRIKLLGTGLYIQIDCRYFIITAEHVLTETIDVYYADTNDHLKTIPFCYFKKQKNIDLGVYLLKNKLENFYEPYELNINTTIMDTDKYFLLGYPGTQSKYYHKKMHSSLRTFITGKDLTPQIHIEPFEIALSFTRQKTYNDKMQRHRFPIPKGMSGGPVFTYYISENQIYYFLIGILTRYDDVHDKTFIATRIEFINEFLKRAIKDIDNHEK